MSKEPIPAHWMNAGAAEVVAELKSMGEPSYRARQLFEAYRKNPLSNTPAISTWPERLQNQYFDRHHWQWYSDATEFVDPDETMKWVYTLLDGQRIQSVMIPDKDRRTLCISSQVGCAMACSFCSTGDMGFGRNLGAGEIVGQWLDVNWRLERAGHGGLTQVVFMGMGEPLHNESNVRTAIDWMTSSDQGLGISPTRITVSTVGQVAPLERLIAETQVNLAVSLHAARPDVRQQIVPAEKGVPAQQLIELMRTYRDQLRRRKLTLEVVLIPGVNMTSQDARELAETAALVSARVNLIPFNPYPGSRYDRPGHKAVLSFQKRLQDKGIPTFIRRTRGERIQAACGTLNTAES